LEVEMLRNLVGDGVKSGTNARPEGLDITLDTLGVLVRRRESEGDSNVAECRDERAEDTFAIGMDVGHFMAVGKVEGGKVVQHRLEDVRGSLSLAWNDGKMSRMLVYGEDGVGRAAEGFAGEFVQVDDETGTDAFRRWGLRRWHGLRFALAGEALKAGAAESAIGANIGRTAVGWEGAVVEGEAQGVVTRVVEADMHMFACIGAAALLWGDVAEVCLGWACTGDAEEGQGDWRKVVAEGGGDAQGGVGAGRLVREREGGPLLDGEDASSAQLADAEEGNMAGGSIVAGVHAVREVAVESDGGGRHAVGDATDDKGRR
jgi:hypothetical protein